MSRRLSSRHRTLLHRSRAMSSQRPRAHATLHTLQPQRTHTRQTRNASDQWPRVTQRAVRRRVGCVDAADATLVGLWRDNGAFSLPTMLIAVEGRHFSSANDSPRSAATERPNTAKCSSRRPRRRAGRRLPTHGCETRSGYCSTPPSCRRASGGARSGQRASVRCTRSRGRVKSAGR